MTVTFSDVTPAQKVSYDFTKDPLEIKTGISINVSGASLDNILIEKLIYEYAPTVFSCTLICSFKC